MEFVKLTYNDGYYSYESGSNERMDIVGRFLRCDVEDCQGPFFREWALNGRQYAVYGNLTILNKEDNKVILRDPFSSEDEPTEVKISIDQFVKLLDDWEQKVCKTRPKEVIIKYENGQFVIETKD